MKAEWYTSSGNVREQNEDSLGVFYGDECLIGIVADGMGGHAAGEIASKMALKLTSAKWSEHSGTFTKEEAEMWLNRLVRSVNLRLYEYAETHEECRGMGTTFAVALCTNEFIAVSSVGDSRIYIWKQGYIVKQITEDHTFVNELLKSGQITKEEAADHPKRNILMRSLGTEPTIALDTSVIDWTDCSHLLICSDGLTNKLSDQILSEIMEGTMNLREKTEMMINEANHAGGEDNSSVIIISKDGDGEKL
ncbi:Stp1/IreP family PP2C-type Ser/Thr phosphatase [Sporolactobacillus shoreicorticis]|uniref:Stp1/IreP family PP2C-type Ser/Thr phosphatase n=1 Tax=Sporolactobacillus shoreicorticis TaxID=1923877 RepID=A0ABW5S2Q3_9BACL|nr:Stp1/IreP family PP2C-type Ser/Thr phosphatase [Sporolactobacillus shoreicorticis]MCO7127980.1 Stp1/IreP family PP2C-type Ser/Thr phosphatase [Sporolactobacillus shoreicorticis]